MTAEIAVMNKEAVALAADSAVTLGLEGGQKIFPSANKIFALSSTDPVGIMIFGGAEFVGMPWETVIKQCREGMGGASRATLQEYAEDFLSFVERHPEFAGREAQRRSVIGLVGQLYVGIREAFLLRAERRLEEADTVTESEVKELLDEEIRDAVDEWLAAPALDALPERHEQTVRRRYQKEIAAVRQEVFRELPMSITSARRLSRLAGLVFVRAAPWEWDLSYTGIVVAGFGRDEYFPHLCHQHVYGVAAGRLRVEAQAPIEVHRDNAAVIAPFAQREMVNAFIEGIEPGYGVFVEEETERALRQAVGDAIRAADVPDELSGDVERELSGALDQQLESLWKRLGRKRRDEYVSPILTVVGALPKDELAAMAESLVNLTSFKRRVSAAAETVGGPIDVAVISKGDGLVWIRRKHYFEPDLNPRYLATMGMDR